MKALFVNGKNITKDEAIDLMHEIFERLTPNEIYEEMIYHDKICDEWERNQDLDELHDLLLSKGYYDSL